MPMKIKAAWVTFLFAFIYPLAAAEKPINQAIGWRSMAPSEQHLYIIGYAEGSRSTWLEASLACPASSDRIKRAVLDSAFGPEAIAQVMADLYKDPANQFVPPRHLVLIAAKKLRGERIEEDLLLVRTRAYNDAKGD